MKYSLIALLLLCGFNACCTKVDCAGLPPGQVTLVNFTPEEVDSIVIKTFGGTSVSPILLDSTMTASQSGIFSDSMQTIYLPGSVDRSHEYHLQILATGKTYILNGFGFSRRGCNTCFPYRPKSDYHDELSSYTINGEFHAGGQIIIYK